MSGAGEMNLGWETVKGTAGKFVQAAIGFAGTIIFARALGPTSFGGYYLLLSLVLLADRPLRGLATAVRKRYSEAGAKKGEIAGVVVVVNLAAIALMATAVFAFGSRLTAFTGVEDAPAVFAALFASMAFFVPVQRMLAAEGWVAKKVWNDTLRSVLTFPLQLGFVLAGFGAAGMGYGLAGATLLVIPVAVAILRVRPGRPTRETGRSLWSYAKYSIPGGLVGKAYDRVDTILIGAILTTGAVGQYEVAYRLSLPATFVTGVVVSGLMPQVSNLHSRGEPVGTEVTDALSYVSILAIPIFFGALALPEALVVTAYGPEYEQAAVLLAGIALYHAVASQSMTLVQTLSGLDHPDVVFRIKSVTLLANAVVGAVLVIEVGVAGAVIGSVLAEALRYALAVRAVGARAAEIDLLPRPLLEQVVAGGIMFGAVELVASRVAITGFLELGGVVGVGGAVYAAVLLAISRRLRVTVVAVLSDAISE